MAWQYEYIYCTLAQRFIAFLRVGERLLAHSIYLVCRSTVTLLLCSRLGDNEIAKGFYLYKSALFVV